jgi:hypothetical protein
MCGKLSVSEPWESRDRKVKKRRSIKKLNRNYTPVGSKKELKPRVSQNRRVSDMDLDEISNMEDSFLTN